MVVYSCSKWFYSKRIYGGSDFKSKAPKASTGSLLDSGDSSDSHKLEMDITSSINDRKTPDSLSSDHATDAATTQLWQALARSAGTYYYPTTDRILL